MTEETKAETVAKKPHYKMCIDLEAVSNTKVAAIGFAVTDSEGAVVRKKKVWWISVEDSEISELTRRRFLDKNPHVLKGVKEHGKPEEEQIKSFIAEWDSVAEELGTGELDFDIIADNPEFDYGKLNELARKYCQREPLRYTKNGEYRYINDSSWAQWALGLDNILGKLSSDICPHTHSPEDDAENIIIRYKMAEDVMEALKKELGVRIKEIATTVATETRDRILAKRRAAMEDEAAQKKQRSDCE